MDAPLKKILRALSLELRHTLEGKYSEDGTWNAGDLERRLNQIGIWRDRHVKPVSEMPNLSPVDRRARELIDAYLALRSDAGVLQSDAVAEFIRESAYSWANRLFALRCMEARGIIDPVILQEEAYHGRSMVHDRFAQTNPTQCTDEDDGLFMMLSEEFRERSQELPDLFAPDSPAVTLRPSVVALKHCIALLSGSAPANGGRATDDVFTAPDAFGWAYQYWNAEEKDRVFEMVRTKKGAKIEGSDIIPATQLYTEPYMVKFLVQNSLGATWMMMHPESKLSATWEYYVKDADRTPNEKKTVAEITFLDPACGSGHFLIEAFDLLYAMYEDEGQLKGSAAICQSILNNNLFGIDIDERAVQITKAVLWMKAAEAVFGKTKQQLKGDEFSEFHDHIIATNIRLPNGKDHLDAFLKKHPEDAPLRPALLTVYEGLQNVHELGSLVQIEEPVDKELKALKEQAKQQRFDPESGEVVEKVYFPRWKQQVMKRLKAHFQEEAEKALPTEAFFSQSAVKGLALFDLLARRYDVVAANPPYMGSGNLSVTSKRYIDFHYPKGKNDLFSAFILRNIQLLSEKGRNAMVTQQSWMFLRTFREIRATEEKKTIRSGKEKFTGLLNQTNLETLAHLGPRAFSEIGGEVVNIVLFTMSNISPKKDHQITAFRLVGVKNASDKGIFLKNQHKKPKYNIKQSIFSRIENSPIIYWLNPKLLDFLTSNEKISDQIVTSEGLGTRHDQRYVRYHWEEIIDFSNWYPFVKGGGYCKWFGLNYWAVNFHDGGASIKLSIIEKFPYLNGNYGWLVRNPDLYGKPGLTYSDIANGSLGVRIMPEGSIFTDKGPAIFSLTNHYKALAAYLNSGIITYLPRALSPTFQFRTGYIHLLPKYPLFLESCEQSIDTIVELKKEIISLKIIEKTFDYQKYPLNTKDIFLVPSILHTMESDFENQIIKNFKFESILNEIYEEIDMPAGTRPLITNYDFIPPLPEKHTWIKTEVNNILNNHERIKPSLNELSEIKNRLRGLYESGPGLKEEFDDIEPTAVDDDAVSPSVGARVPIPAETFLEELSQKMEIHPISIYCLLKEGIEKEGWRCIPEEKRYTEDLFTMIVLQLLGHRWPKQIEAGEPVPEWADVDGIIPITSGLTHPTLLQQVQNRVAAEFPGRKIHEIEKVFEEVVGMSLDQWLAGEFFKHHISQFKKRPIAWHLSSSPSGNISGKRKSRGSRSEPAFSCIVYYHKIDTDILHKIRTQYVGELINRYATELRSLESRKELNGDQATRKVQLENWIAELKDFSQSLQDVADRGFDSQLLKEIVKNETLDKWTSRDGKVSHPKTGEEFYAQEKRYDPDINDGVRVNIAPLQNAGLLIADVIAKKDLGKAITDRAEWRSDERRWCREGELPKCGWWK